MLYFQGIGGRGSVVRWWGVVKSGDVVKWGGVVVEVRRSGDVQ